MAEGINRAAVTLVPPAGLCALATSSVVRRSWRTPSGARAHHLLDPRSAAPADSDCLQATVIANDLGLAEVYAKCLVILGTRAGPPWLAERDPSIAWIMVDRTGRARAGGPGTTPIIDDRKTGRTHY